MEQNKEIKRDTTFDIAKGIAFILIYICYTKCSDRLCEFVYGVR